MVKTTVSQPERYQGNSTSTKYINKVTLSDDGSMSVVATPVAKANILPTLTTTTPKTSTANQIVSDTKTTTQTATTVPKSVVSDGDGVIVNPQPPGPPGV
jgi:hypothetical protein